MIHSPGKLQTRLFWAFAAVTVIAAVLPAVFSRGTLYEDRLNLARRQVLAQAMFAAGILDAGADGAQVRTMFDTARDLSLRMTLTDASGRVLRDNNVTGAELPDLDSHADRPEIEAAKNVGQGTSLRHSNTLGIDAMYAAVSLKNGGFLRAAAPLAEIRRSYQAELSSLAAIIGGVAGFCLLLSVLITAKVRSGIDNMAEVVASIATRKGQRRLLDVPGSEFLPLGYAVNRMAENIEEYVETTTDQHCQLEVILDSMHEGVLVLGPSGNIRKYNKTILEMFPKVETALGRPLIEGLPVPDLQRRVDVLIGHAGASAKDGSGPDEALHFELPPGRFLVAHLSRPVEPNNSLGAVLVIYDATEILRLERVRKDFVANVSHELRTPLTAISGYAETLMELDDIPEQYRGFAVIIHKHAAALARIVSDLLALARIEDTRENIAMVPINPAPVLQEALAACAVQAADRQVRFEQCIESQAMVLANSSLLLQVFRNLLENACRYSPQGGTVRIDGKRQNESMLFVVSDAGPGIAKADLPRIFERFYQVDKQRNSGTSGIGLAICKHIVERHGGGIWAESPYGGAATAMLFTLPLADGEQGTGNQ